MTHYYIQINIRMYSNMIELGMIPIAHTYNGFTQQLVIIEMNMTTKELDRLLLPIIAEYD